MKKHVKTLIERKHMVRDGDHWRRVGYSESIMSQFDRWRLDLRKTNRSIHIADFQRYDFVEGLGDPEAKECFPCHLAVILYVFEDEAAKHGVVDNVVEAQPHQAKMYDRLRKQFFGKPRTGRVLCPKISPLLTFFQLDADIESLGKDINCCDLPLPNMVYDHVVYDNVLFDSDNAHTAVKQAHRVLRPGGYLILTEQLFGPLSARSWWRITPAMLRQMLSDFYEVYIDTWGGPRSLIHMIASGGGWGPLPSQELKELLDEHDPRWPLFLWAVARK